MNTMLRPSSRTERSECVAIAALVPHGSRRWAPYGREVQAGPINVYCFAGPNAWHDAQRRRAIFGPGSALLLPPDESPEELRWPCVSGGVLIDARDIPRPEALKLAVAMVSDGTPLAYVIGTGFSFPVTSPDWRNPLTATRTVAA